MRNLWRKLRDISAFTTVTVKISKTKIKRLTTGKKIGEKFNLSVAEVEVKFRHIRTVYGCYLKRLKTLPSELGQDAVPREFQNRK